MFPSIVPVTRSADICTVTSHAAEGIWLKKPHCSDSQAFMGFDDIMPANLMSQPYPEGDHYPGLAAH